MRVEPEPEEILLRKAHADLVAARLLLPHAEASDENVGFLCQQAVKKALKAILTVRGLPAPFTHDLQRLLDLLLAAGVSIPAELSGVASLTPFGVALRYDFLVLPPSGNPAFDREVAVAVAAAAVTRAESSLP